MCAPTLALIGDTWLITAAVFKLKAPPAEKGSSNPADTRLNSIHILEINYVSRET
jgi:hypothetical protein